MIHAENREQLIDHLKSIDIKVPLRSQGRNKEHTERYAICYLLATLLNSTSFIKYPISVISSERPDFVLGMDGLTVGIEHTEAVSENVAHADALREKGVGDKVHFVWHSKPGEKRAKHTNLVRKIEENKPDGPWMGDSVERMWVEVMSYFTEIKITSSEKSGFTKYKKNYLLIYDNWRLPVLDLDDAMDRFFGQCVSKNYFNSLNGIYILSDGYLCVISSIKCQKLKLNRLWG